MSDDDRQRHEPATQQERAEFVARSNQRDVHERGIRWARLIGRDDLRRDIEAHHHDLAGASAAVDVLTEINAEWMAHYKANKDTIHRELRLRGRGDIITLIQNAGLPGLVDAASALKTPRLYTVNELARLSRRVRSTADVGPNRRMSPANRVLQGDSTAIEFAQAQPKLGVGVAAKAAVCFAVCIAVLYLPVPSWVASLLWGSLMGLVTAAWLVRYIGAPTPACPDPAALIGAPPEVGLVQGTPRGAFSSTSRCPRCDHPGPHYLQLRAASDNWIWRTCCQKKCSTKWPELR